MKKSIKKSTWNRSRYYKYLVKKWKRLGKDETTRCAICGKQNGYYQIHPHHIVSVRHKATAWDLANRVWVCAWCHTLNSKDCVQNNLGGWFINWDSNNDWMYKHRRCQKQYLQTVHKITKKWTLAEMEEHKRLYLQAEKDVSKKSELMYLLK